MNIFKIKDRDTEIKEEIAYLTHHILNGGYLPSEIVKITNELKENVRTHLRSENVRLSKELSTVDESLIKLK